jgi:hypothetical protein
VPVVYAVIVIVIIGIMSFILWIWAIRKILKNNWQSKK